MGRDFRQIRKRILAVVLFCIGQWTFPSVRAEAAGDEAILFLHHSTGNNVYYDGDVPEWFAAYNSAQGTTYQIAERPYPNTPYPWDNYPYDYWNLWVNGACNSAEPNIECMNTLAAANDVIVFKHCFPGAAIQADTGNPSVSSNVKSIENYQLQYRALRSVMDSYPNTLYIVWTLAPLHRLATNSAEAARARQFVDWVKTDFLTENGSHPNIRVFDFFGNAAGVDNYLKYEYELDHFGSDSHPNLLANQTIGPVFAQFVVDATESFGGTPDTTPPSAPVNLAIE